MNRVSRRNLARYGADQLLAGSPADQIAKALASVLIIDKRQAEVQLLLNDIDFELENRGKAAITQVTSARELTDKLRTEISQLVKKATKTEQIIINELIDKDVIGGVRIETATRIWDKTVAKQLNELREAF